MSQFVIGSLSAPPLPSRRNKLFPLGQTTVNLFILFFAKKGVNGLIQLFFSKLKYFKWNVHIAVFTYIGTLINLLKLFLLIIVHFVLHRLIETQTTNGFI